MKKKEENKSYSATFLTKRFKEETREQLVSRTSYLFMVGSILYLGFFGLDWLTDPDQAIFFLYIRLAVTVNLIVGVFLLKIPAGKKLVLPISIWGVYVTILGVSFMTIYLNGFLSNYYIGIILILLIPGLFLPWNFISTLLFGVFSIATYFILNLTMGYPPSVNLINIAGPFFFMLWSFLFLAIANIQNEKTRLQDLRQRIQIEKANEDLKELDKSKMMFFSNVSHELRTPLTLIIGPLEQLMQEWKDIDPMPLLKTMETNAHRLLRQVNTILDFAKTDAGKMTCRYENANLGQILSDLVQATIPYARQRNIEINISGVDKIPDSAMDIEKVETIAANLISNALKFISDKGRINIRTGNNKHYTWFEIEDTGIGIPVEKQEFIFERFHQVENELSRGHEGTGLGLAMVRELVLLHGGKINLHSEPGKGSTFRVELPKEKQELNIDRRKGAGRRKSDFISNKKFGNEQNKVNQKRGKINTKTLFADVMNGITGQDFDGANKDIIQKKPLLQGVRKILVVEDNFDLRAFIVNNLDDIYLVEQAENGKQGLDVARKFNPDLIISDVMMPEMDGYELCRKIRKDPFLSDIPIILVTAKTEGEAVVAGLEIGATDYVPKPFAMRELKARVAAHLKNRSMAQNISEQETRLSAIGQKTSSVVHDLRSPLNLIMGYTQIAQLHPRTIEDKKLSGNLTKTMESCNRLNRMIVEILEFAKGYTPRFNIESIPLIPLLEKILSLHKSRLATMDISLLYEYKNCDNIKVAFDTDQINRVIDNLIMNSKEIFFNLNHAIEDKKIWVMTTCNNNSIVIRFADNGPGIPEKIRDSLFDPFTTSGKKSGTGLGLATVYNIVSAHSGKITVESNGKEGGAVFELKFPVSKS